LEERQAPENRKTAMLIVAPLGRDVNGYLKSYGEKCPNVEVLCPSCGSPLKRKHGKFLRGVVYKKKLVFIPIYRRRCSACRKTASLIPAFLRHHSQIPQLLRESASKLHVCLRRPVSEVSRRLSSVIPGGISERTVIRWASEAERKAKDILPKLLRTVQILCPSLSAVSLLRGHPVEDIFRLIKAAATALPGLRGLGAFASASLLLGVVV